MVFESLHLPNCLRSLFFTVPAHPHATLIAVYQARLAIVIDTTEVAQCSCSCSSVNVNSPQTSFPSVEKFHSQILCCYDFRRRSRMFLPSSLPGRIRRNGSRTAKRKSPLFVPGRNLLQILHLDLHLWSLNLHLILHLILCGSKTKIIYYILRSMEKREKTFARISITATSKMSSFFFIDLDSLF